MILLSDTNFIARHDHDDIALLDRITLQMQYLQKNKKIGLVGARGLLFNQKHEVFGSIGKDFNLNNFIIKNLDIIQIPHPTWLVNKKVFKNYRYNDNSILSEDQLLLYENKKKISYGFLNKSIFFYRDYSLNLNKEMKSRVSVFFDFLNVSIKQKNFLILIPLILFHSVKLFLFLLTYLFDLNFLLRRYRKIDHDPDLLISNLNKIYEKIK